MLSRCMQYNYMPYCTGIHHSYTTNNYLQLPYQSIKPQTDPTTTTTSQHKLRNKTVMSLVQQVRQHNNNQIQYPHSLCTVPHTINSTIQRTSNIVTSRLTEFEKALFILLLQFIHSSTQYSTTQVRVAGGWIRDKLLNEHTEDIDLVIDHASGSEFAELFRLYIIQYGINISRVGIIKSNPLQSKHITTATFTIDSLSIDCNNFRTEYYTDSRIPVIAPGTALQDAERRDFTINSLYYNINTTCIEDYTGNGLIDYSNKLLRTPLDASITFNDDPLRVLRAARFSGRLNFQVHDDIVNAAKSTTVKHNLLIKVSRERVGQEINKMLHKLYSVVHSFQLLSDWALRSVILQLPDPKLYNIRHDDNVVYNIQQEYIIDLTVINNDNNQCITDMCMQTLKYTDILIKPMYTSQSDTTITTDDYSYLLLSSYLCTYYGYQCVLHVKPTMKKTIPLIQYIILNSLKLSTKVSNQCSMYIDTAHNIIRLSDMYHNAVTSNDTILIQQIQLQSGYMLRQCQEYYTLCTQLAIAYKCTLHNITTDTPADTVIQRYIHWLVSSSNLIKNKIWLTEPFLRDTELVQYCQQHKISSRKIGEFTTYQINYQHVYPTHNKSQFMQLVDDIQNQRDTIVIDNTIDSVPNKMLWSEQQLQQWWIHNTD